MSTLNLKQLRRAETMLNEVIQQKMGKDLVESTVTFQKVDAAREAGDAAFVKRLAELSAMVELRQLLRNLVAVKNRETGVDAHKAKMGAIEAHISSLHAFAHKTVRSVSSYGRTGVPDTFTAGLSEEKREWIDAEVRKLRLEVSRLKDKCGGINSNTKVEVNKDVYAELQKLGCI